MGGLVGSRDIVKKDLVWVKHCCIGQSKCTILLYLFPSHMPGDERQWRRNQANFRSAIGDKNGFQTSGNKKDVSGMEALFPDNPARRVANKSNGGKGVKKANESDVSLGPPGTRIWADCGRSRKVMLRPASVVFLRVNA